MSNYTTSPQMNLILPTVGQDPGPDWAFNLNNSLTIIDGHNHSPGYGVPIPAAGLNIQSDLTINSSNLLAVRSVRFTPQSAPLALAADLGCIYESGVDLWYNDGSGNKIQITSGGGVAGTPGSISGLTPPASASYVAGDQTFVWQSAVNTPANMDFASAILRNLTANSFGLTLNPPSAMGANITETLPTIPSVISFMSMDSTGNMGTAWTVDGTTIGITANKVNLLPLSVDQTKIAIRSTGSPTAALGAVASSASSTGSYNSSALGAIPNLSVSITTNGNPVFVGFQSDGSGSPSFIDFIDNSGGSPGLFEIQRGTTPVLDYRLSTGTPSSVRTSVPSSSVGGLDFVAAGTYTYTAYWKIGLSGAGTIDVANVILVAYEIK